MKKKGLNKKGISPLIATVLLIGFTVAIIALVIIWGRSYTEEKAQKEEALAKAKLNCQNIDFTVTQAKVSGQTLTLTIKNKGIASIDSFVFRVNDGKAVLEVLDKVDSGQTNSVQAEDAAIADILTSGQIERVEIIPKEKAAPGVYVPCSEKSKTVVKVQHL